MGEVGEESPSLSDILSYLNLSLGPTKRIFTESWSTSVDSSVDFESSQSLTLLQNFLITSFPVVGKGRSGRLSNSSRLASLLRLFARQVSVCFHEFDNRIVRLCNSSIMYRHFIRTEVIGNGIYTPRIYRPCDRASSSLQCFSLNGWIKSLVGCREDSLNLICDII